LERRSIRYFSSEPVDRRLVRNVLRDALWAPSPHNAQPWRFTVLFNAADKHRLAEGMAHRLQLELEADGLPENTVRDQTERSQRRITSSPVVILVSLHGDGLRTYPDPRRTALEWQMAVQSVGSVLQTLFLLAHDRGLGSCWMAAPMYCPDEVRAALDLPREFAPQALALLGYPERPGKVRRRRDADAVIDLR
jgi:coenzyme F420-0:L-glutamate ligase / coenzyme F420-1:gamma-L-glutamate ligase